MLDDLPQVDNSHYSPCWQQKQIAAQKSYIETVQSGKQQVYKADCSRLKKTAPPVPVG